VSLISQLIQKKRDGQQLTADDLALFVEGITSRQVSDAQIAAFTMAVWFRGLDSEELRALTLAMRDSGAVLHWPDLDGPVLDKHSTGGVGDLISLVLAPMVAACGGFVPMISGRGLGHTGGTLDKLESIPGFNTAPGQKEFQKLVRQNGFSIIGQTHRLAPADARMYAVRDVTATVASTPLIVSSILSKKLAEGLDALVMDIKVGSGAFMENRREAENLARAICDTAHAAGLACDAVLTDMSQPISFAAGNALEMREACAYLTGEVRHPRLHAVVLAIASQMLILGGLAGSEQEAAEKLLQALENGQAAERFARLVVAQGGPADLLERPHQHLPAAPYSKPLLLEREGWISHVNMARLGLCVVQLGGGRLREEDSIDHAVGLSGLRSTGEFVAHGEEFITIHARSKSEWLHAATQCLAAIELTDHPPAQQHWPVVLGQVD